MSVKTDLLMYSLTQFFNTKKNIDQMIPIIDQESKISLRLLDWFITNYSKKFNINYKVQNKNFNVHLDYKAQLKSYSKKQFDPFCRRERLNFVYDKDTSIETTVGQLCFFRWSIKNNILKYVLTHYNDIEKDMTNSLKKEKIKNKQKRTPLSVNASRSYTKTYEKIIVSFD
jgi:hypothetical protein